MRNLIALLFCVLLAACGGGSGGGGGGAAPPVVPIGTVSGTGFDGLLINADIKIYDFSTGTKGGLIGQGISDNSGLYNISLQIESRPILIEATGGYYLEEAGSGFQVKLSASKHKLSAVANYTTGATQSISATNYTHLAAGLAGYQIGKGASVAAAIDEANARISALIGVDILTTTPVQITDPANSSASLSPGLRYGFLSGGISMWTYNHTPTYGLAHKVPYTSIDFAQLMYQDIAADGILDGMGFDTIGKLSQLSFGTTPLNTEVYRLGIGVSMLLMANDKNNKTGLDGTSLLPYVQSYIASTDSAFNNVPPTSIEAPVVVITSPTSNANLTQTVSVAATISTASVVKSVELLLDNVWLANATNLTSPTFTLNTVGIADGTHIIGVRVTDVGGLITTSSVSVMIINTKTAVTITTPWSNAVLNATANVAATVQSSVGLRLVELLIDGGAIATAVNPIAPTFAFNTALYADGSHTLGVRATDVSGAVATSTIPVVIANIAPVVSVTSPAAGSILRGNINISGAASSSSGLSSVELQVDGRAAGSASVLSAPAFSLNTSLYPDGAHTLSLRAIDVGGLVTTSTVAAVFANVAPVVNITAPASSAILRGINSVTATTQSLSGITKNELLVDGLLVTMSANLTTPIFSLNTPIFLDGAHTIGVRSTDVGGLVTTASVPVIISNIAPTVSITAPIVNSMWRKTLTVTATSSSPVGLSSVELLVDGRAAATAANLTSPSFSIDSASYADGAHTLAVRATDIHGLVTTASVAVSFDNTAPTLSGVSVPASRGYSGSASGFASDGSGSGVASIKELTTGALTGISPTGSWALSFGMLTIALTVQFQVTDVIGNCNKYDWVGTLIAANACP